MNRNDRKIVLTALAVAVVALFAAVVLDGSNPHQTHRAHQTHETHETHKPYETQNPHSAPLPQPTSHEVFPFDPNTADSAQLARLGLQHWQIRNIYRYRAKGGVYRKKEDFARLYGLTVKDYRRLEPYIRISSDYQPAATLVAHKAHESNKPHETHETHEPYPQKIDSTQHIVLNTADTTELKRVPGIGSYYAKEIVRYGRWLGGYVSVEQLDEIDQFPTSAKKYFVVTNPSPQRLNINSLSLQQLRRHPYINYFMAKTIVEHRRLHGRIKNLQELSGYRDFTPQIIRRLEPYIAY